jgi:tRNA(Ile)-lysidine synthase
MAPLGPFEPAPSLAAAVSGGADSMALALLANDWARARGGSLLALVVDHGLRPASAAEASLTLRRLEQRGIAGRLLTLRGLLPGPALAERARAARYDALRAACAAAGILHLLLGHHAGDQAETVLMRRQGGSGPAGLAAMPALAEYHGLRLLRPLLPVPPVRLRLTLRAAGLSWVEDPSNADQRTLRARLRASLADPDGTGAAVAALCEAAQQAGRARATHDAAIAAVLAQRAVLRPEGFALLLPGAPAGGPASPGGDPGIDPAALAALLQAVSGTAFPPPTASVAALAAAPRPATLWGVRLLPAGRLGPGWLVVREAARVEAAVPAHPGALWDGRFCLSGDAEPPAGATLGALGGDAARVRPRRGHGSHLPAAVLRTLPALRCGNFLVAVPHLLYPDPDVCAGLRVGFCPRRPAAGAPFKAVR